MRKSRVYLIAMAAVCVALAAMLSLTAVSICREGLARRAANPLESVYTPQIVAERFAPIAPLFLIFLALLVAGLALGIRDERADRPSRDAALTRDLAVSRVCLPSEAMARERTAQRRLLWIGRVAFALCMVPVAVYLLDPGHFPPDDPEVMFSGILRVFLPWTTLGLTALAAAGGLRDRRFQRETEAAKARAEQERREDLRPALTPPAPTKGRGAVQALILIAAVALIVAGIVNGSARDVLYKAIAICTECIGLG